MQFKILLITYKALHSHPLSYTEELIHPHPPHRALRPEGTGLLVTFKGSKDTSGGRSFRFLAASLWTHLLASVQGTNTVTVIKLTVRDNSLSVTLALA